MTRKIDMAKEPEFVFAIPFRSKAVAKSWD